MTKNGPTKKAAPESDLCMWGDDCRRLHGLHCPENCLWIHRGGESYPRCFGYHKGRGLFLPGHPHAAIAARHCATCVVREDCINESEKRFGLPTTHK